MRMQPDFEKANEIYFRLGIIYKQQQKYQQSLEVSRAARRKMPTLRRRSLFAVLPIHCFRATDPSD